MPERPAPAVYSIAAHRGFADALVAGLVPRYSEPDTGLARLTLLLPSQRATRTVTEAFIRHSGDASAKAPGGGPSTSSGHGLLMPRMVVVGDLDLDEKLGPLLDPIGAGAQLPPPADPVRRWLRIAELIREEQGEHQSKGNALLRLARDVAATMDRLLVEDIGPEQLLQDRVLDTLGELAGHWRNSLRLFARVQQRWLSELEERGELDPAARRNRLFDHAARKWREQPPAKPVVAAGVTSAAPALARLLRVVADLPHGAVVLPDLDLVMDSASWDELGAAGQPDGDGSPIGRSDAVTHPQYHLKLLLNRMNIARSEVRPWHRAGLSPAPPERSRTISNLFLPPRASKAWAGLPPDQRRLSGVRLMETANPEEEAQAVALLVREAVAMPERRVAVVTPDRSLAARIVGHLRRWNITADDSAGRPLSQTAAGRIVLLLAQVAAEEAAPVPLFALLEHPLAGACQDRAAWLERARLLELRMRGPKRAAGLAAYDAAAAALARFDAGAGAWWDGIRTILAALLADKERSLAGVLDDLVHSAEALCGDAVWSREDGRALANLFDQMRGPAAEVGTRVALVDLPIILRDLMDQVAVRPSYGGHPRIAIYGLLEARMSRADLVICAGLNEGTWPQRPSQDALLAPAVLRALGVPGADFRIGLSAHDLAGMLGSPEVVLSRSERNADGPAIPSRFLLRVKALLGDLLANHVEIKAPALARAIDDGETVPPHPRPEPRPTAEQRDVPVSVTALDRLRSDPYQFYAQAILRLRKLDPLDAEPSAAWRGEVAHAILQRWHESGGDLREIAAQVLEEMNTHPLIAGLWGPRLLAALDWIEAELNNLPERQVAAVEKKGEMKVGGVIIHGRVDRIDSLPGGELAIVDYKTGRPPSDREVAAGYALQLGTLGLMARAGAFEGVSGEPTHFEYWSLGSSKTSDTGFGYRCEPIREGRKQNGIPRDEFLDTADELLRDALGRWITGNDPFTARLNPDAPGYADYDQLMRLDEWQGRVEAGE